MTLSAKQIINLRDEVERESAGWSEALRELSDMNDALIDFFLSQQPRPIEEAKSGEKIHACWLDDDGAITTISTVIWTLTGRWVLPPTHFIPLDALPLPEGE